MSVCLAHNLLFVLLPDTDLEYVLSQYLLRDPHNFVAYRAQNTMLIIRLTHFSMYLSLFSLLLRNNSVCTLLDPTSYCCVISPVFLLSPVASPCGSDTNNRAGAAL